MTLEWDNVSSSCLNPVFAISLVSRCPWSVRARVLFSMQGLCGSSVHLCAVLFLADKMRLRLETCIICNRYHSLMVSALPLAAHNGPFLRFSASCSAFWWWRNGDSGCHLGRNKKNDGTFHLLVRKLALLALDMMCIQRVLVPGVADNNKGSNCPSKGKRFSFSFIRLKQDKKKMSHIQGKI